MPPSIITDYYKLGKKCYLADQPALRTYDSIIVNVGKKTGISHENKIASPGGKKPLIEPSGKKVCIILF